jgi:Flp pilus assembly pilin Flp
MRTLRSLLARLCFAGDERGAILVEYTAVFAFVSIGLVIAIVKCGPILLAAWDGTQKMLLASKP